LKTLVPDPEALLAEACINPELRAEQVPPEGFATLAALLGRGSERFRQGTDE
jgi:16S rRNA A1518/A1519 N6-dimethyltransferase RsmA/KsgA/DIM1 with predicted DNA glycosylase/AP lyase activity